MRSFALCSVLLLSSIALTPQAFAASYLRTDGTVVDPILTSYLILDENGQFVPETHPYSGVDLAPGTDLQGAALGFAGLGQAALAGADLRDAELFSANLRDADLTGANLTGSDTYLADLSGANLTSVVWADSVVDELGIRGANLSFADLRGWTALETGAIEASFNNANLDDAFLAMVALNADFSSASLRGVEFALLIDTETNLSGANLSGADLTGASFSSVVPEFARISLLGADFSNAVLHGVVGLENTDGAALYDSGTDFTNSWADLDATVPFDPVAAGWTFVPNPVPEPSTALLMGLGLVGLAGARQRNA